MFLNVGCMRNDLHFVNVCVCACIPNRCEFTGVLNAKIVLKNSVPVTSLSCIQVIMTSNTDQIHLDVSFRSLQCLPSSAIFYFMSFILHSVKYGIYALRISQSDYRYSYS